LRTPKLLLPPRLIMLLLSLFFTVIREALSCHLTGRTGDLTALFTCDLPYRIARHTPLPSKSRRLSGRKGYFLSSNWIPLSLHF
jgi:hypothetical protein